MSRVRPAGIIVDAPDSAMRLIAACLLVLAAAACGTKGALYLPPPEPAEDAAAKQKR
jgi:predicted small lipoprotein YifL